MWRLTAFSMPEVEETCPGKRRSSRLVLILPFAGAEGAIGLISFVTGVFRIPEAGSWVPVGFWVNTGLVVAGNLPRRGPDPQGDPMTVGAPLKLPDGPPTRAGRAGA